MTPKLCQSRSQRSMQGLFDRLSTQRILLPRWQTRTCSSSIRTIMNTSKSSRQRNQRRLNFRGLCPSHSMGARKHANLSSRLHCMLSCALRIHRSPPLPCSYKATNAILTPEAAVLSLILSTKLVAFWSQLRGMEVVICLRNHSHSWEGASLSWITTCMSEWDDLRRRRLKVATWTICTLIE